MLRYITSLFRPKRGFLVFFLLGIFISYLVSPYVGDECSKLEQLKQNIFNGILKSYEDEYEPRINTAGKLQKSVKGTQNLVRPRYYSSELGIKEKLFVGVLTNENSIRTLSVALNKTTTHLVNKLMFFIDTAGAEKANVITLKLNGIVGFVDTKDILMPFHTLKYLIDNFIEEYEYFLLVKDSTYINIRHLRSILENVSARENIYSGPIKNGVKHCSLDGGILLSNLVLRSIQLSLDWCVKNAVSKTIDDNLRRCIQRATKMQCQENIKNMNLKTERYENQNHGNLIENLNFEKILSFHGIDDPNYFYQLHLDLTKKFLKDRNNQLEILKNDLDATTNDLAWPAGSYPVKLPNNRFDLLRWDYFDMDYIYFPTDFINKQKLSGSALLDIQIVMNRSSEWISKKYHNKLIYKTLKNGYRRFDPSRGLDYILDINFLDSNKNIILKRLQVCKPLGRVEILPVPFVTESTRVTFLLPVHSETKTETINFMKQYSHVFMQTSELVFLMLILLYEPDAPGKGHSADTFKEIKEYATSLSTKHKKDYSKIAWLSIKVPNIGMTDKPPMYDDVLYFAMMDLATKKLPQDSHILLCEPNMELKPEYINRVRMNTIQGRQVFSPIPFMQYNPKISVVNFTTVKQEIPLHKTTGHFDEYNKRHLAFYATDYVIARTKIIDYLPYVKADKDIQKLFSSYDNKSINENVIKNLFSLFVINDNKDLSVLRAPEPALRLKYIDSLINKCEKIRQSSIGSNRYEQYNLCNDQTSLNLASRSQLAARILEKLR